ncbi:hypothetical protein CF386_09335 [Paraphotobacterium marinum]|uniref:Multidrug resistance protein NorM n=1 Tax=Paraphotobacterium marinum TaxID=1755811 RepID=A0A220VH46_9GAMM|nr:MATE family efflux transporter [Paraphotobacterium marinum]ASK79263.1 hypothetical protein CF386_09335 [Paraphotobacterium marinum]
MENSKSPLNIIIKKSLQVSLSIAMTKFIQVISGFIGMIMIAHLGNKELAASAMITPIQAFIIVVSANLLTSVGILISKSYGARDMKQIGAYFKSGLIAALLLSIFIDIVLYKIDFILNAFHQPSSIITLVQSYTNVYMITTPLIMIALVFQQFLIAVERKKIIVLMSLVSLFVINFFSYSLIYGNFGLPKLGIPGLAWSTTIWLFFAIITYSIYILKNIYFIKFEILKPSYNQFKYLLRIFKVGFPMTIQSTSEMLQLLTITFMVGWLGTNELAIQQIVNQYFILLVVPIFALSQSSSILISQSYGAQNKMDITQYGHTLLTIGLFFASLVMILFISIPQKMILFYVGQDNTFTPEMLNLASVILILTGSRLLLDTVISIKIGSLRGILDMKFPMYVSILTSWLLTIPLAYLFCFQLNFGLKGITYASIIMMLINSIILLKRWAHKSKSIAWESS